MSRGLGDVYKRQPKESGWLVPAGDSSALASAMIEALKTPTNVLDVMGGLGAVRTREMHSVDTEAAELVELFASIDRGAIAS